MQLVELLDAGGARDWRGHCREPASHARATCAGVACGFFRNLVESGEDAAAALVQHFLHALPARALAEIGFRAVLAGEEPARQARSRG